MTIHDVEHCQTQQEDNSGNDRVIWPDGINCPCADRCDNEEGKNKLNHFPSEAVDGKVRLLSSTNSRVRTLNHRTNVCLLDGGGDPQR